MMRLDAPIMFTGFEALSVETPTTVSTAWPCSRIARTTFTGPMQFVRRAWSGKYSQVGTCFIAAAFTTRPKQLTSPRTATPT